MGTSARTETAGSCTQARQGNRPHNITNGPPLLRTRTEPPVLDKQKDSTCSKVWVDRFGQSHRHAHGRRDDEERDICIVSLDDVGNSHQQFTVMPLGYHLLHALLQIGPEIAEVQRVNSSIHESEAIGRANYRVAGGVEDRAAVNVDPGEVATKSLPCVGERLIDGCQHYLHRYGWEERTSLALIYASSEARHTSMLCSQNLSGNARPKYLKNNDRPLLFLLFTNLRKRYEQKQCATIGLVERRGQDEVCLCIIQVDYNVIVYTVYVVSNKQDILQEVLR